MDKAIIDIQGFKNFIQCVDFLTNTISQYFSQLLAKSLLKRLDTDVIFQIKYDRFQRSQGLELTEVEELLLLQNLGYSEGSNSRIKSEDQGI
jgi:hypothetical protein